MTSEKLRMKNWVSFSGGVPFFGLVGGWFFFADSGFLGVH